MDSGLVVMSQRETERAHVMRAIEERRLRRISTMQEANRYLPEFMDDYNRRFGRVPATTKMPMGRCSNATASTTSSPGKDSGA